MKMTNLNALGKKELIEKIQKLERKNQRLESKLIEANLERENEKKQLSDTIRNLKKALNNLNNEYNKWSVNNVIPIDKTEYTRDEIRQILAWDEGCKIYTITAPENHEEYFKIKDEWYEVKMFSELLQKPELEKFKFLKEIDKYRNLKTKDDFLNTYMSDKKTNQRKIMHNILKKDESYYYDDEPRKYFEKKEYYEAFKAYIERELKRNEFMQLGKYNLYKIWIDKEYADATAQIFAADKAEADFYTSQDGYDSSKLYEGD